MEQSPKVLHMTLKVTHAELEAAVKCEVECVVYCLMRSGRDGQR